jgi:hypothetical protein
MTDLGFVEKLFRVAERLMPDYFEADKRLITGVAMYPARSRVLGLWAIEAWCADGGSRIRYVRGPQYKELERGASRIKACPLTPKGYEEALQEIERRTFSVELDGENNEE